MKAVPGAGYTMPDDRSVSGTISNLDLLHAGSLYSAGNWVKQPFLTIFNVLKLFVSDGYVAQVPDQIQALIFLMPGQFTAPEIK